MQTAPPPPFPDAAAIAAAAQAVRAGRVVVFPTETVYGLGADATNPAAVAEIFRLKGRPADNPLITHVASLADVRRHGDLDAAAERLAEAFWPGPLTLIVRRGPASPIVAAVSAGLPTLAIRVPGHLVAQALLRAAGCPIAAPSANPSGRLSPTRASHLTRQVGAGVAAVLDAGPCHHGLESTVVDTTAAAPRILRLGAITAAALSTALGRPVAPPTPPDDAGQPLAPGTHHRHYAPATPLRLNATTPEPDEAFLAFGPDAGPDAGPGAQATLNLSPAGDLAQAAANLYHMLHTLDRARPRRIAVAPIPHHGLGAVINERLARAAAAQQP